MPCRGLLPGQDLTRTGRLQGVGARILSWSSAWTETLTRLVFYLLVRSFGVPSQISRELLGKHLRKGLKSTSLPLRRASYRKGRAAPNGSSSFSHYVLFTRNFFLGGGRSSPQAWQARQVLSSGNFEMTTRSGGSLGSCVDEERSQLRELM